MGRPHEVASYIKQGKSPSQTASAIGISTSSVLKTAVGYGLIRESGIVFAIPRRIRDVVDTILLQSESSNGTSPAPIKMALQKRGFSSGDTDDGVLYSKYREALVAMGDMYDLIYRFETRLHRFVRDLLIDTYGEDPETGWWRRGIDEDIRKKCAVRREEDPYPADQPFKYADLIDLWKTLKRNWKLCEKILPTDVIQGKTKTVEPGFEMVNRLRNRVMHPCKGLPPTEEEFLYFKDFVDFLRIQEWKIRDPEG